MDIIQKLLQQIKQRPELYLGEKSLSSLFYFISGYETRELEVNPSFHNCLDGFEWFVHSCYNDVTTQNWKGLIIKNSNSQEDAFDHFFTLFDRFTKDTG